MEETLLIQLSRHDLRSLIMSCITELITSRLNADDEAVRQRSEELLTKKDAAKLLGVSNTTLHNWNIEKKLPAKKINRKVYYLRSEVLKILNGE